VLVWSGIIREQRAARVVQVTKKNQALESVAGVKEISVVFPAEPRYATGGFWGRLGVDVGSCWWN